MGNFTLRGVLVGRPQIEAYEYVQEREDVKCLGCGDKHNGRRLLKRLCFGCRYIKHLVQKVALHLIQSRAETLVDHTFPVTDNKVEEAD